MLEVAMGGKEKRVRRQSDADMSKSRRQHTRQQGDSHGARRAVVERYMNRIALTIVPVLLIDSEAGLSAALGEVRRDVHFDAHLLIEARSLRVASRDQDTPVWQQL